MATFEAQPAFAPYPPESGYPQKPAVPYSPQPGYPQQLAAPYPPQYNAPPPNAQQPGESFCVICFIINCRS
jgi:hypothetical protein